MTAILSRSVPILFAASALAFAASTYVFAPWNDVPFVLPVPADGSAVKTPFILVTAGDFRLRLSVPTVSKSVEVPVPNWPGSPCIILEPDPENGADKPIRLDEFRTAGLFVYGGIAYFESSRKIHLSRGRHTAALRTCAPGRGSQLFTELARTGEPTGQFFLAWIVRSAGWILSVIGVLATIASFKHRRAPAA